jgi:hypothetical protein
LRSNRVRGHLFDVRNQFLEKKNGSTSLQPEVQHKAATTPENFGSTSLPPEVQHKAATTPENFGSESAYKIRSPLSGHLSLESTKFWQRKRVQDQVTFIRPPFS